MNLRRLSIALVAALLLSVGVTWFLNRKITARNMFMSQQQMVKVVAAARPLQAGEVLKADNLVLEDWPSSAALAGAFKTLEEVNGRSVIYPVAERQPILDGYLALAGSGIGLTGKIREGMRAISVRCDQIVGVAGFLFPGSHVDVLVTIRDAAPTPWTQIVLQDVEVLTAGQKIEPDPQGKPENIAVVTLLLKPEDAEKVGLASSLGTIHFALRNGADHGTVIAAAVNSAQLLGSARPATSALRIRSTVVAKNPPYVVETIIGKERATSQFE
jgi:pilus assembly protein CpaB